MGFVTTVRVTEDDSLESLVKRVKDLLDIIPKDFYTLNKGDQIETYVNEYAQQLSQDLQVLARYLTVVRLVYASGIMEHDRPEGIEVNDKGCFLAVMGPQRPRVCGLPLAQRKKQGFLYFPLDPEWKIERTSAVQFKVNVPNTIKREGTTVETPSPKRFKGTSDKD